MPRCCVFMCNKIANFRFPMDKLLRKKWMLAINRKNWKPTESTRVCRDHFLPSDFCDTPTSNGSIIRRRQRLKPDVIPSVFTAYKPQKKHDNVRGIRLQRRLEKCSQPHVNENDIHFTASDQEIVMDVDVGAEETVNSEYSDNTVELPAIIAPTANAATQAYFRQGHPTLSIEAIGFDQKSLHYFTGLESFSKFQTVFLSLGPAVNHLKYFRTHKVLKISPINQFLLMLARLRQDLDYFMLSKMCDISVFMVENIFITWVNFCSRQWNEINKWPSRELVSYFSPPEFKMSHPTTRVIIDATEVGIEKPSNPVAQRAFFSSYKNKNTVKVVVGATPGGLVSYVSPAFGGATSDRQIIERSKLPEMCQPGDSVMGDKGFNVNDLFLNHHVFVNIPSFFKKKNRLTHRQVLLDRKVSSKRIHIERIIGMAKTYKILQNTLKPTETRLSHHIFNVCFMLVNFRNNIVGNK